MIKINLLGVAPPPSKVPSVGGPPAPKATQVVMFVGALIICFGIVGVIYKVWTNQIADLRKSAESGKDPAIGTGRGEGPERKIPATAEGPRDPHQYHSGVAEQPRRPRRIDERFGERR